MADPRVKVDAEGGVDVFLTIGDRLPVEQVYADREEARKEALWRTLVGPVSIDASEEGLARQADAARPEKQRLGPAAGEQEPVPEAPGLEGVAGAMNEGLARVMGFPSAEEAQRKLAAGEFGVGDLLRLMDPAGNISENIAREEAQKAGLPPELVEQAAAGAALLGGLFGPGGGKGKAVVGGAKEAVGAAGRTTEQIVEGLRRRLAKLTAQRDELIKRYAETEAPKQSEKLGQELYDLTRRIVRTEQRIRKPPPPRQPRAPRAPTSPDDAAIGGESRINLERVQATASVKRTMARINAMQAERLAESRATVSHEATIAAGRRFTLEDALAAMPEELDDARALQQAVRDYHNAVATRLDELAPMAADGIPSAVNEVADLWVIAGELSAKDEMLGRGAARMLEARKILSEADRAPFTIGDIAAVRDRIGLEGVDGQVIGRMLLTLPKSQREAFARATVEASRSGQNMFYTIWINFLLSGPQTHAVNALSNTATSLWAIPERWLAQNLHFGADPGVFRGEAQAMLRGLVEGFGDGIRAAGKAIRTGQEAVAPGARKVEIGYGLAPQTGPVRAIDYLAMLVPTRWLASSDAFFKAINYRMEVKAQALRQAMLEGLEGKAAARRMLEIERAPEKYPEIHRAAESFALAQTFQKEMTGLSGRFGEAAMKFANLPMGRLVLPFVRTPTNLAQYAGQRTPVLNLLSETLRRDIRAGGAARDLALAKVATSAMVGATVMTLAGAGVISGAGPKDRNLQRMMRDSGWQPYSIRVGDTWYSYNRLDPFGMMLGVVADAAQVMGQLPDADALDLAGAISLAMVRNMTSKTYMTGLADFLDAIENPDARGRRFLESLARTAVPTGVRQVTRTIDPELKEVRGMVDQILSGIPGFSATLPPRRNLWGDPIVLGGGWGPDLISPIYTSEIKDDPVSAEIIRNRISLSMPSRWYDGPPAPKGIQLEAPRLTPGIELTPEEYDRYIVLVGKGGQAPTINNVPHIHTKGELPLKDLLAAEMKEGSPYWSETDSPEGGKARYIGAIVEARKKLAKAQLYEEFPDLRKAWEQHREQRGLKYDPKVNPPARRAPAAVPSFNLTR